MMKRSVILIILGLSIICALPSCKKNSDGPSESTIKSKIIGKWKSTYLNGIEELTNEREIRGFWEDGTSISSTTKYNEWLAKTYENYGIKENVITIKKLIDNSIVEQTVSSIDDNSYSISRFRYLQHPEYTNKKTEVFKKIHIDYTDSIVGLWEGVSIEGDTTYGSIEHRWEYKTDSTYTYYNHENGDWVPSDNTFNEYNVDGDWLASRWIQEAGGEMYYEWWDIEKCEYGEMIWVGLREREDGTRFTTKFVMRKVKPTE